MDYLGKIRLTNGKRQYIDVWETEQPKTQDSFREI